MSAERPPSEKGTRNTTRDWLIGLLPIVGGAVLALALAAALSQ